MALFLYNGIWSKNGGTPLALQLLKSRRCKMPHLEVIRDVSRTLVVGRGSRGVASRNFWGTSLKLSQMRGNALLEKFSNVFGQISRIIIQKVGFWTSHSPLGTPLAEISSHESLKSLLQNCISLVNIYEAPAWD